MTERMDLGKRGEDEACAHLKEKGYKVLLRNYREKWGELDIVARDKDKTLVCVEVKTMSEGSFAGLTPEDQMSAAKMRKFRRTAEQYANAHPELVNDKKGWRLDVMALIKSGGTFEVYHYINV